MEPSQLKQVESLCETLYTGAPTTGENGEQINRGEAQQRLMSLQQSADFIPQCQYILENTQSQYARLVATNSLTELITTHWNSFTIPQRIDIRNYVLTYLANNGPQLESFVVVSLIKLVCRITKLGWFDDPVHRELADDVTKFLQATVEHCILGLKILNQLVDELNIPTSGRTLTQHRKTSVSFRDVCLLKVFQLGLTTLKQLQTRSICKSFISQPYSSFDLIPPLRLRIPSYFLLPFSVFFSIVLQPPIRNRRRFLENIPSPLPFDVYHLILLALIRTNQQKMLEPFKHLLLGEHFYKTRRQQNYFSTFMPIPRRHDLARQWKLSFC